MEDGSSVIWLDPDLCHPHPNNPRLQLRDDVVDQIAFQLSTDGFQVHHAITVRPNGDGYQIIAGHHRVAAAKRAGVEVAAWVVDMDDDTAFMQLVLSNTQGELDRLEMSLHARQHIVSYGDQSSYAAMTGRTQASVSQMLAEANVASSYKSIYNLVGRSTQLLAISKASEHLWPLLVDTMLQRDWSVRETKAHIATVLEFDIPDRHHDWLPPERAITAHLDGRFSPRSCARLITIADQVDQWIDTNADEQARHEWRTWLKDAPLDHRQLVGYQQRLIAEQYEVQGWHHGDWRDHLDDLEDGTVALLLTDPPYGINYQSNWRNEKHTLIEGDADLTASLDAISALIPKLADDAHVLVFCAPKHESATIDGLKDLGLQIRSQLVWDRQHFGMGDLTGTFAPQHDRIVHAVKGSPVLHKRTPDVLSHMRANSDRHPTEKPIPLLTQLIEATTTQGQLVADPFGGVASTAVAAKDTGRRWWSCEIDADYYDTGEERLA